MKVCHGAFAYLEQLLRYPLRLLSHTHTTRDAKYAGGGEVEGRVTRAEWREHHLHLSALIAADDAFCDHLGRVWGCGSREEDGRDSSIGNNGKLRETTNSNRSFPIHESDGASMGAEGKSTTTNNNGDGKNIGEHRSAAAEKTSPRPALPTTGEACPLPPPPPSNAARGPIIQRGHIRDEMSARLTAPSGVLGLLGRARDNLALRGMRAAFQLLKSFREEDRRGNRKVTLSGFKKAVGGAALGLNEPEMRIIFEVTCHMAPCRANFS